MRTETATEVGVCSPIGLLYWEVIVYQSMNKANISLKYANTQLYIRI